MHSMLDANTSDVGGALESLYIQTVEHCVPRPGSEKRPHADISNLRNVAL